MPFAIRTTIALAIVALFSTVVQAQPTPRSVHFNVAAGATLPLGTFSDVVDVGYHVTGGIGMREPTAQIGFRGEASYNGLNVKNGGGNLHVTAFTANATYDLSSAGSNGSTLYLIGGAGAYNVGGDNGSDTHFGWNAGMGFRWPLSGFAAYVEGRFHFVTNTANSTRFVPLSFGLQF